MIYKKILNPGRIRKINQSVAFIEHRFRSWMNHLTREELLLYFFLVLAADELGLSFYNPASISLGLHLTPQEYERALKGLIARDLAAYQEPLFQVLSLPENRPA